LERLAFSTLPVGTVNFSQRFKFFSTISARRLIAGDVFFFTCKASIKKLSKPIKFDWHYITCNSTMVFGVDGRL